MIRHYYKNLIPGDLLALCGKDMEGVPFHGNEVVGFYGAEVEVDGTLCEICALLHIAEPDSTPTYKQWRRCGS